ncbi:MAG: lipid A export permease/ATP-binding protein MsbA [Cellvibrionaceae bacterium]|nr:lipid A export permease/ATP-binding protein MsbA [Cellvibrionaceae bacterium]
MKNPTLSLYYRLLHYIFPYKKAIVATIAALVCMAAMEPLLASLFQRLVDDSLIAKDPQAFVKIPLMLAAVFIIKGVAEYFSKVSSRWIAEKAILEIRAAMFAKLHRLPLSTHQAYGTGKMMSKITYDVPMASDALANAWMVIIRDLLTIIALLCYLLYVSWQLTLLLGIAGPLIAFILDRASKLMRRFSSDMQKDMGALTERLEQGIRAHRDIKMYRAQAYENTQFRATAERLRENTMKVVRVAALNVPLVQVIAAIALSIIVYIATLMAANDYFSPGGLVGYITAMSLVFEPIRRITNVNETIQQGMAAADSIFQLLDQQEEQDTGTQSLPSAQDDNIANNVVNNKALAIEFKQVTFCYHPKQPPILSDFSLTIAANKTTALVGYSGSGKTSIVNLISRFHTIDKGSLRLGNININDITLSSLRQHIALVSQNIVLFNDSLAANIAYGHDHYDRAAIKTAAQQAHAWEFIQALPEGLDTVVGDNGCRLSGGQRQRIALARAFLKQAPILILDEATSALDNKSEHEIQKALAEFGASHTVIIVAHRLSSIQHADTIVVLNKGQVVEQGQHQQLLQQRGYYYSLYEKTQ